ncbi:MAG: RNA polymerase sigma factor RpoD/SigA [Nitrospinota bacterium]
MGDEERQGKPEPEEGAEQLEPVTDDTLGMYLREIREIPLLTREEEQELARRLRRGEREALNRLVRSNLKYVVSVANRYKGCGLALQDLINEGNIGLIQAAKRFDPDRGVKFITYAVWWIRQAVMHALAQQAGTVRLPIKQANIIHKIGEKRQALRQRLGREPTAEELAGELGISPEDVDDVLRVYRHHLSLDAPIAEGDNTSYLEMMEQPDVESVEAQLLHHALQGEIEEVLAELPEREQKVLRMRFGFEGEPMTLEEIGKRIGLSRERIRQIEKRAKRRLRAWAKRRALRDYLN